MLLAEAEQAPEFVSTANNVGRATPIDWQLAMGIWRLGRTVSVRDVAQKFGVSPGHVVAATDRTLHYIVRRWGFMIQQLPETSKAMTSNAAHWLTNGFFGLGPLRNVIAAIDGTLIPIWRPVGEPHAYFCRKGFHAINFQVVVDAQYRILSAFGGRPGSCWDGNCLAGSYFEKWLALLPSPFIVLADSGYVASRALVTPFKKIKGWLPATFSRFNYYHALSRNICEKTIGVLKARFRWMLKGTQFGSAAKYALAFAACCILHNMCIESNDDLRLDADASDAAIQLPKGYRTLPKEFKGKIDDYVHVQERRCTRSNKIVVDDEDVEDNILQAVVDPDEPDFTPTKTARASRNRVVSELIADGYIDMNEAENENAESLRLKAKKKVSKKKALSRK